MLKWSTPSSSQSQQQQQVNNIVAQAQLPSQDARQVDTFIDNKQNDQHPERKGFRFNRQTGKYEKLCNAVIHGNVPWYSLADKHDLSDVDNKVLDVPKVSSVAGNEPFNSTQYVGSRFVSPDEGVKKCLDLVMTTSNKSNSATINALTKFIDKLEHRNKYIVRSSAYEYESYLELLQIRAGFCLMSMRKKAHNDFVANGGKILLFSAVDPDEKSAISRVARFAVIGIMAEYLLTNLNLFPKLKDLRIGEIDKELAYCEVEILGHNLHDLCSSAANKFAMRMPNLERAVVTSTLSENYKW